MFRGTEDKLSELRRALAHLGFQLGHLSGSRFCLGGDRTELGVDVGFSGGANGTYNVKAESPASGFVVIIRWIEAEGKWLVIDSQSYLNSIGGSVKTPSWTKGRRHWSTTVNHRTRPFLFDTSGAARRLSQFLLLEERNAAAVQSFCAGPSISPSGAASRLPCISAGSSSSPQESSLVYMCDRCLGCPPVDQVLRDAIPVPSFGSPSQAEVLTIGINPSVTEFYVKGTPEPRPSNLRLPLVPDYGVTSRLDLTVADTSDVRSKQESYFRRPETHPWFRNWRVLLEAASASWSYERGTAAHADLVACTTDMGWGRVCSKSKQTMMSNCREHFLRTLEDLSTERWTLWDGEATWPALDQLTAGSTEETGDFKIGHPPVKWRRGRLQLPSGKWVRYLAWDQYVNRRMSNSVKEQLGRLVI